MSTSRRKRRPLLRWSLWLLAIVVGLFALQATVLAFPQLLLPRSAQSGTVVIYSRAGDAGGFRDLAERVDRRLRGCGLYHPSRTDRVYLFEDPGLYRLFVRLSLLRVEPQGFNLSIFGNSYISITRHRDLGERTGGLPKYSIWDGDLSHLIAHEIAHQYVIDRIGRGAWRKLPHWKQEGIPEYLANIGPVSESGPPLAERVALLLDDGQWQTTRRSDGTWNWDRIHYEAGLMVEYLIQQEECTLDDITADRITADSVRPRMIAWSRIDDRHGSSASDPHGSSGPMRVALLHPHVPTRTTSTTNACEARCRREVRAAPHSPTSSRSGTQALGLRGASTGGCRPVRAVLRTPNFGEIRRVRPQARSSERSSPNADQSCGHETSGRGPSTPLTR